MPGVLLPLRCGRLACTEQLAAVFTEQAASDAHLSPFSKGDAASFEAGVFVGWYPRKKFRSARKLSRPQQSPSSPHRLICLTVPKTRPTLTLASNLTGTW